MQKITIKINNIEYEGFDDITISQNIENFCSGFSFTSFSEKGVALPFEPGKICEIFLGGDVLITGLIDSVQSGFTNDSHFYNVSGRDATSIIVDSSAKGNLSFTTPINLIKIMKDILKRNGLQYTILEPEGGITDFTKAELPEGEDGENMFTFFEKLGRQKGLLIRTNNKGNITLDKKQGELYNVVLLNELNGNRNNILEANYTKDDSQRYHTYSSSSQTNMSSGINVKADINITGLYTDTQQVLNPYKYLDVSSELSDNGSSIKTRAEWECRIRAARSRVYSCKVQGFIAEDLNGQKKYWETNKLIKVTDVFNGIDAILLIRSILFNYSQAAGSTTTLELVPKDAYLLESEIK